MKMLGKSAFVMLSPWKPHTYYLVGHGNLINKLYMMVIPTNTFSLKMGKRPLYYLYHFNKLIRIEI